MFQRIVLLLFLVCFTFQLVRGQTAPEIITLDFNKPIEREISGNIEAQNFQISVRENQYAKVVIEQTQVDIAAKICDADGELLTEFDNEDKIGRSEIIEFTAGKTGNYRIEIENASPKSAGGKYVIRLIEKREATANEKLLDEARRKFYEAQNLNDAGNFDQALEFAERALEIRGKVLGENNADTATSMIFVSRLYMTKNNLAQADVFARRALEAAAKISGEESLIYADALNITALIRHRQANYTEAESLNRKTLSIREKSAGENSIKTADSLQNLALLYRATNDYPKAEQNFTKALGIYEKKFGDNRFETAVLLNNFGMFYYGTGDFKTAEVYLLRSLAVKEKTFPANHRQVGIAYSNLGLIEWKNENYEKAKVYYLRALKIFEVVNGLESDGVANILGNLGIIYKESDEDKTKAEEYYKRALAINVKNYGENHQNTANIITSLAILYQAMGDNKRAEQFGLRALTIYENVLGEYNNYTILALGNMIRLAAANGEIDRAVEYSKRLNEIHEKIIPLNLQVGSERQKIAYYKQTSRFDQTISLHTELAREDDSMRDLAVTAILRHKGRIMDAVSENMAALRQRFDPADQKLLDELSELNSRLSKLILSSPKTASAVEQKKQIETLEAEREKLESEISRRSAGFYQSSEPVTLDAVRNLIPDNAALVEFAVYRPFQWKIKNGESRYGESHYIAYVVRREGDVEWKELGDAKTIDAAVEEFRNALSDPKRGDVRQLARAVDAQIMSPIRALLGDTKTLLVSPDGALNLIPFEALVDEQNHYLIENYSFTYLTSGRDLLRMQTARISKSKSLLIANPQFGESVAEQAVAANQTKIKSRAKRQSVTATRNMTDTYFAPISGTLQEARLIQTQFPDAQFLTGTQATETALKQANAPNVLHIATHGFFLADENLSNDKDESAKRGATTNVESENPLLRSGLAFAGANRRDANGGDDGILTALEASGLNLWGTKLVVLSACDTGLGQIKNGEGVYGLRRSFVLAGAESLVMSLWSVSDYVTRETMIDYYKNLKNGVGRGDALRKVKLEMLKRKGRTHPFYWAAFIQSGEWANLDGKR